MEALVTGMVFTVPQTLPEEYAAAEARLNRGKAAGSFMADQQRNLSNSLTTGMYYTLLYAGKGVELTTFF